MVEWQRQVVRLASASPRRLDLLRQLGIEPEVCPASIDEIRHPGESVGNFVQRMALAKAQAVWQPDRPGVCLGADTVVFLGEEIFHKPCTPGRAAATLERLSGRMHRVATGLALCGPDGRACRQHMVVTRVWMRQLSAREIGAYVATGEPLDKAGGYAIQGLGAVLVERIAGSYTNVVGLPVGEVAALLAGLPVNCLNHDAQD
jgi:septum formation protein